MSDRGRKSLLAALAAPIPKTQLQAPQLRAKPTRKATMTETLLSPYGKFGATEPGNIDLTARPHVKNPDGSTSTVRSMGVNIDGKEYLIPTVNDKGYVMGDDEAVEEFLRTGRHMGVYDSPDASTRAAEEIHLDQERNPPRNTLLDAINQNAKRSRSRKGQTL